MDMKPRLCVRHVDATGSSAAADKCESVQVECYVIAPDADPVFTGCSDDVTDEIIRAGRSNDKATCCITGRIGPVDNVTCLNLIKRFQQSHSLLHDKYIP